MCDVTVLDSQRSIGNFEKLQFPCWVVDAIKSNFINESALHSHFILARQNPFSFSNSSELLSDSTSNRWRTYSDLDFAVLLSPQMCEWNICEKQKSIFIALMHQTTESFLSLNQTIEIEWNVSTCVDCIRAANFQKQIESFGWHYFCGIDRCRNRARNWLAIRAFL